MPAVNFDGEAPGGMILERKPDVNQWFSKDSLVAETPCASFHFLPQFGVAPLAIHMPLPSHLLIPRS